MIEIVKKYNSYIKDIPKLVKESYFKSEYFLKFLSVSEATYYRKLRTNTFTPKEITIITELLFPEEIFLRDLEKSEEDIKEDRVEAHEVVIDKLRLKYFS